MIVRICLKDKSSVHVKCENLRTLQESLNSNKFVTLVNYKTGKEEIYQADYIWCVRISSKNESAH